MVFFDISNPGSIAEVPYWVEAFRSKGMPTMPVVLIGTKLDLASPENERVAQNVAQMAVEQLDLSFYMPTSSKMNVNVSEVFDRLMRMLIRKLHGFAVTNAQETHLVLQKNCY